MSDSIRIVLDGMGGDNAPAEHVKGAVDALNRDERLTIIITGDEALIRKELDGCQGVPADRLKIVHTSQIIETSEPPVNAVRKKKDSSLVVGLNMVKNGEADAIISSGNTGALMVGATVIVGRIRGVERVPIATLMPTKMGVSLMLDAGANVDPRPSHLVQFAQMGSIYMEHVIGVKDPSVGIVNLGVEEDKGNALVKETFPLLRECKSIRFTGSVEARDIPYGAGDVIVTDAFSGNMILKMYEGTATVLLDVLKEAMMSTVKSKIGALMIKDSLKQALKTYDATEYGGAPLLGLKNLVVKAHGSAKAKEIRRAIEQCVSFYEADVTGKIAQIMGGEK